MSLEQMKADRFKFLKALYDASGGDRFKYFHLGRLGDVLGFDQQRTLVIGDYLKDEGLIAYHAFGPIIGITHHGIREVEEALSAPEQPTHYFPAVNVISIGSVVNSTIAQASTDVSQVINLSEGRTQELLALLNEL